MVIAAHPRPPRRARQAVLALAAVAGLLVSTPALPAAVPTAVAATGAPSVPCPPGAEWQMRDLVNNFRALYHQPALPLSAELTAKAQAWSDHMMFTDSMVHSNTYYGTLSTGVSSGWGAIGENIAYNYSVANAEIALQNSPPHKANLIGDWTEMGLGISSGPDGRIWVTQVFVARSSATTPYTGPADTSAFDTVTPTVVFEPAGVVAAATTSAFQVTGQAGVPAGATAAVVTIEASQGTGRGFVQGLGPGTAVGSTANLNLIDGRAANTAVIPLAPNGTMRVFNSVGAHLRVSVVGYFSPAGGPVAAGRFTALTPSRLLDTRAATAVAFTGPKPAAGDTVKLQVTGRGGVPSTGVRAVALNVVATQTDAIGAVQVGAGNMAIGAWRNLLTSRVDQTIANLVIVPVDGSGKVALNVTAGTHLVVDVQGWFTTASAPVSTAGLFVPSTPGRFLDSRTTGNPAAGVRVVEVGMRFGLPQCPSAVLGNLAVIPVTNTYAQLGPYYQFSGGTFSSLNADTAGVAVSNAAIVRTGMGYGLGLYTPQFSQVVVDLSGWFV